MCLKISLIKAEDLNVDLQKVSSDDLFEMSLDDLLKLKFVGSRKISAGFTSDSVAPYDLIGEKELDTQFSIDVTERLRKLIPSFNLTTHSNSDEAGLIRPFNIRGLAPDQTLVLVNGKRRHRGGAISYIGNGVSDGSQGPDISSIPVSAISSIQFLRDGAAAQYGSDAIAGVINFNLKNGKGDDSIQLLTGRTSKGDGELYQLSASFGGHTQEGFNYHFAFESSDEKRTERQEQRADAALIQIVNPNIPDPAQTWGRPDIKDNYKALLNFDYEIGSKSNFYGYLNLSNKYIDTVFYYRTPNGADRTGRYSNDDGMTVLVGDLNPENNIDCPVINIIQNNPLTSPGFELISNGGALDNECYALAEKLPNGYTPIFSGDVEDKGALVGFESETSNGLRYDLSAYMGASSVRYYFLNSLNPSNPDSNPNRRITPGKNKQRDININIDTSYGIDVGLASELVLSGGLEWRREEFFILQGEKDSYQPGILADQGFLSAVDGYSGFTPQAAGRFKRENRAIYLEAETDWTENFVMQAAIRSEEFDGFGSSNNYKIGGLYKLSNNIRLRATVSSGFRAPTPAQLNSRRTSTLVTPQGILESGVLPPSSLLAQALSDAIPNSPTAKSLKPEESKNVSLGILFDSDFGKITADLYRIDLSDRITLSPTIIVDRSIPEVESIIQELIEQGVASANSINSFQFFVNDFETLTKGIDIGYNYSFESIFGVSHISFDYNYTHTRLKPGSEAINELREIALENVLPKWRYVLSFDHKINKWTTNLRMSHFGKFIVANDISTSFDGEYSDRVLTDLSVKYQYNDNHSLSFGVENIFDITPERHPSPPTNDGEIYPFQSPYPIDGRYYYLKYQQNFD
ncbi:TonB-dependent receptor plug domain-containing protein [Pleionea sediminis]|uniref:TonB-dependent receptor plug domain-containing protein n=1 Tax=Pleionea sediminis TaxID=2569479 RepID=UPI0013DE1AE2|nr:TonB-dependent receptor [Pleionea sediminis]